MLKPVKVILNKFEKKEPLLRVLREEYESLTETRPRLSGVCEIATRLWNVRFNEKMKSKNYVNIEIDEPLFYKVGKKFDFSTDFVSLFPKNRMINKPFVACNDYASLR